MLATHAASAPATAAAAAYGARRATTIVHLSPDEPPILEGAGPISTETAEHLTCDSRLVFIKPHGNDLVHSRMGRDASWYQSARSSSAPAGSASTPAAPPPTSSKHTT